MCAETLKYLDSFSIFYISISPSPIETVHLRLRYCRIVYSLQCCRYKDFTTSAKSKVVVSFIGNKLYIDIHKVAEEHIQKTRSPSLLVLLCLWFCYLFFFFPLCSFSCCFPVEQIHRATGAGCHLPKNYASSKLCGKLFMRQHKGGWGMDPSS